VLTLVGICFVLIRETSLYRTARPTACPLPQNKTSSQQDYYMPSNG
jgi:hypothetical protein